jgi:hypothetical protein
MAASRLRGPVCARLWRVCQEWAVALAAARRESVIDVAGRYVDVLPLRGVCDAISM